MSAEKSKKTPDKRRKYNDAFKAEALRLASESRSTQAAAQQLGISPKLLYRWQQAQLVAEVGSVEVARDPGSAPATCPVKAGRAGTGHFKKSLNHLQPADPVSTYRYIAQRQRHLPVRQLCQTLRVSASTYYAWQRRRASSLAANPDAKKELRRPFVVLIFRRCASIRVLT
jgi:transposase